MTSSSLPDELLHAAPELRPHIRLSPFQTHYFELNREIALNASLLQKIRWSDVQACLHPHALLTRSGRVAIRVALRHLALEVDDEVLVWTTGGSPYVSRCVTDEIGAVCNWSRVPSSRTRCILVIHSFGFRAELPEDLTKLGVPIIEDCAYAFGSADCGSLGDLVIYSFPKAFPIPFGGLLLSRRPVEGDAVLSRAGKAYLMSVLGHYVDQGPDAYDARLRAFEAYRHEFGNLGLQALMNPVGGEVPHAFVVEFPDEELAARIRSHMNAAGIESSVYYGSGGYYVPCHQTLGPAQISYIVRMFGWAWQQEVG